MVPSPLAKLKCVKNSAEIEGMKLAQVTGKPFGSGLCSGLNFDSSLFLFFLISTEKAGVWLDLKKKKFSQACDQKHAAVLLEEGFSWY